MSRINLVFVDTSALLALVNSNDGLHERATAVQSSLYSAGAHSVTTEWVLTEFLNHTASPGRRRTGLAAVDSIMASGRSRVLRATHSAWRDAVSLYRDRIDKGWSLVDCTSILACRRLGITRVFTHDRHFA